MVRYELWSKLNNIYQEVLSELARLKIIEKKKKNSTIIVIVIVVKWCIKSIGCMRHVIPSENPEALNKYSFYIKCCWQRQLPVAILIMLEEETEEERKWPKYIFTNHMLLLFVTCIYYSYFLLAQNQYESGCGYLCLEHLEIILGLHEIVSQKAKTNINNVIDYSLK